MPMARRNILRADLDSQLRVHNVCLPRNNGVTPIESLTSDRARAPRSKPCVKKSSTPSRCDAKVLVTGESGVGKEIVARLIHAGSERRHNPLVTVNCAALTESLLETELFGHVRGSFTGAYRDRTGVLEQAHRGTIFMDEIGETTPRMQGLLLRFLETGEIQRVGSERTEARVNVRVIAATNRNLVGCASRPGRSATTSIYRLNVIQLHLPPLRERLEDVPALLAQLPHACSPRSTRCRAGRVADDAMAMLGVVRVAGQRARTEERRRAARRPEPERPIELADLPINRAARRSRRRRASHAGGRAASPTCSTTRWSMRASRSGRRSTRRSCRAT